MAIPLVKPQPPSTDKRWRIVDATMRRAGFRPRALIESLHSAQEAFGFLDLPALRYVSTSLRVPLSRAYGVVTFYNYFSLKPAGDHSCVICLGTACYIKGGQLLLKAAVEVLGVGPGHTSPDGKVSLLTARCLGSCGLAPAVVYDQAVEGKVSVAAIQARMTGWTAV